MKNIQTNFSEPIEDLPLTYRLRLNEDNPRGLVILLHGVGGHENSMAFLARALPDDLKVVVVRAPHLMSPSGYCFFKVKFTANGPVIDEKAAEASRLQLIQFVELLQARLNVSPLETIIAGFSQGGIMSASLALTAPERVRAFGILCGRILPQIEPLIASEAARHQLSALILHGTLDQTLPIEWADKSSVWLNKLGVPLEDKRYEAPHELTPAMIQDTVHWVRSILSKKN
jgi:phospholipase/carboxylesterase